MKNKKFLKYLLTIIISFAMIFTFCVYSQAFSLNIISNTKNVSKGDIVTVTATTDDKFVTGDFELKYNSDVFEYIEETQTNVTIKDYPNQGYLVVVYADISGKGTNSISIKFKSKAVTSTPSQFSIQKQNFTDTNGTSYDSNTVKANPLSVSIKENNGDEGTNGPQNGNNGDKGTTGSQNGNNDDEGTNSPQNGNNGDKGTTGSQNDNNGNKGTTGSQNDNNGNKGTTGSQNQNSNGKGLSSSGTANSNNKNTINGSSTQKSNSPLPKTGVGLNVLGFLILVLIVMAIVFRKKIKYWNITGMFILAFSITIMLSSGSIQAYTKMHKYGVYNNLIDKQKVLAICLDKDEKERDLKVEQIPSLVDNVSSYKDKSGNTISGNSTIGTGSKVQLKDNTEYVVLLYGDVNGDGKINSNDIYSIIQHILKNQTLSGVYAKAANLNNKDDENDQNINSSDIYPIIKFILGDLKSDLVNVFPSDPDVGLDLKVSYDKKDWTKDSVVATISSSLELVAPDSTWQLSKDKKQISKAYQKNTEENVTITSADGKKGQVKISISNIDKTAPSVSGEVKINNQVVSAGQNVEIGVAAKANDAESGIDKIMYEVYKGEEKVEQQQITDSSKFTFPGTIGVTYDVKMYAIDKAGNTSEVNTIKIEQLNYVNTEDGKKDLEAEKEKVDTTVKSIEDDMPKKENELSSIKDEYGANKSELDEKMVKELEYAENERKNNIANCDKNFDDCANNLAKEKENKLEYAKNNYENKIADAKKSGASQTVLDEMRDAYYLEMESIRDEYEHNLHNQMQQYEQTKNDIDNNYNKKAQSIREDYTATANALEREYNQKMEQINIDINNLSETKNTIIANYNSYKNNLESKVYIKFKK